MATNSGLASLLNQVKEFGLNNIPPATLALIAGQVALFMDPGYFPPPEDVCISSYHGVSAYGQYWCICYSIWHMVYRMIVYGLYMANISSYHCMVIYSLCMTYISSYNSVLKFHIWCTYHSMLAYELYVTYRLLSHCFSLRQCFLTSGQVSS